MGVIFLKKCNKINNFFVQNLALQKFYNCYKIVCRKFINKKDKNMDLTNTHRQACGVGNNP